MPKRKIFLFAILFLLVTAAATSDVNIKEIKAAVPPLPCPGGFSVSCNASATNATINWNDLSGAVRYMIRVNADPVGDWVGPGDFADEPINSIYSFSVEGGRGYTYDVQGIRAGESYPYSGCRAPFDRFVCNTPTPTPIQDGFEEGLGKWEVNRPENITISSDLKYTGSSALRIKHDNLNWGSNASYRFPSLVGGRVAVWIYDDLSNPDAYIYSSVSNDDYTQGTSIGIRPQTSTQNYVYCPTENQTGCMDTGYKRTRGWHQFKIFATPKGTYGKIDGTAFSYLPANEINGAVNFNFTQFQRVNLGIMNAASGYFYFDEVYIDTYPPAPSETQIAMNNINLFLDSYANIDITKIDQMIKARESEFCSVDYDYPNGVCPDDGSKKPPHWHYNEQLFHVYDSLLYTAGAHSLKFLKEGSPKDLEKAVSIISYIDSEYGRWKENKSGSLVGNLLAQNSWLIWDKLEAGLKRSLVAHLKKEGNFFEKTYAPYSEYIGNSSGEENSWPALYLNTLARMFWKYPEAINWYARSKFFAFHSLTKGETYGGFTSRTIYDDYLFDNHDYHPHPAYAAGPVSYLASMDYFEGTFVEEYEHNAFSVWKKAKEYIDFRNFQFKGKKIVRRGRDLDGDGRPDYTPSGNAFIPSGKDDWGRDALWFTHYRLMKEVYSDFRYSDPETGFSTNDLSRHAAEYIHYIKSGYLWRVEGPNIAFSEMLMDNPGEDMQERQSYRWFNNAEAVWDFVAYLYHFDPDISLTAIPLLKPGDANGDGKVDGLDYIIWLNHYNQTTGNGIDDGDFNEDSKVDGLDYVIWLNNYEI